MQRRYREGQDFSFHEELAMKRKLIVASVVTLMLCYFVGFG